ncbi:MAG: tRNA cytidylyltransferase [Candidatus Limnocylindrales bacterium]
MDATGPPFAVHPEVLTVLGVLWARGHAGYLVGGGVRDALLGLPVDDWDIATDARPEQVMRIFPGSSYQNRFGTVLARGLEVTTFRRDHRYADHRRPDSVTFSQDIFEDLARRDLTINAIAWGRRGPDAGARVVDPADGQGDLEARLVRAVGDPDRRFDEDALRLLRAVRIAAKLDFAIEPMTLAAMAAHAADVEWVSEERVGGEVRRMLDAPAPSRAFGHMAETGILATTLPELDALEEHQLRTSLAVLDRVASEHPGREQLALAALLGELDPASALGVLRRLRLGAREAEAVTALVAAATEAYEPGWTDADVRRYMGRVPAELRPELLRLRAARAAASAAAEPEAPHLAAALAERVERQEEAGSPLTLAQLAIDGRDLRDTLGLPEGPIIGDLLEELLADVIEDPSLNTRTTLLTRASLILDRLLQQGRSRDDQRPRSSGTLGP